MKTKQVADKTHFDSIKWLIVAFLVAAGVVGNYYFAAQPAPYRLAGWLVLFIVAGLVALQTRHGLKLRSFAKESRVELRKVVWPTRAETVQTTMIVIGLVILTALILWSVDSILLWAIGWLTGQHG